MNKNPPNPPQQSTDIPHALLNVRKKGVAEAKKPSQKMSAVATEATESALTISAMATNSPNQPQQSTDMPDVLRDVTEKGLAGGKEIFENMNAAATEATESALTISAMATNSPNQPQQSTEGLAGGKEIFEDMNAAATGATEHMQSRYATILKGIQDYSTKVLEFAHVNMTAAIEHGKKLVTAKTPAAYFELTNEYMRTHIERLSKQAQELAAIAQKTATSAAGFHQGH